MRNCSTGFVSHDMICIAGSPQQPGGSSHYPSPRPPQPTGIRRPQVLAVSTGAGLPKSILKASPQAASVTNPGYAPLPTDKDDYSPASTPQHPPPPYNHRWYAQQGQPASTGTAGSVLEAAAYRPAPKDVNDQIPQERSPTANFTTFSNNNNSYNQNNLNNNSSPTTLNPTMDQFGNRQNSGAVANRPSVDSTMQSPLQAPRLSHEQVLLQSDQSLELLRQQGNPLRGRA